ncbi:MAG: hypothetical protein RSC49_05380, partial [Clostridium sp.]
FIIGAPSVLYMTFRILDIFNFNGGSFVGNILSYLLEGLREFIFLISGTLYNDMIFNTWYRGWLFIALGIIGLLYCLIIFIAEKYSNDIYARLFPFKVSKILVYTGIYFFVMVCVEWVSRLVIEVGMNIVGLYGTYFSIAYNAPVVVAVLAFPLLIKVTNKIVKKLNETF